MSRLAAAFASSHSLMLVATREDWIANFRASDRSMPLYGRKGEPLTYDDLLAAAPSTAEDMVTPEKMSALFDRTHATVARLRSEIEATELDALIVVGDDQHELFHESLMPSVAV